MNGLNLDVKVRKPPWLSGGKIPKCLLKALDSFFPSTSSSCNFVRLNPENADSPQYSAVTSTSPQSLQTPLYTLDIVRCSSSSTVKIKHAAWSSTRFSTFHIWSHQPLANAKPSCLNCPEVHLYPPLLLQHQSVRSVHLLVSKKIFTKNQHSLPDDTILPSLPFSSFSSLLCQSRGRKSGFFRIRIK